MTLKIERISGKRRTRIRLSGEVRAEHLDQLKAEIERAGPRVALDLEEVDLVDVEGVRFLNACVAEGISVLHCSPYIREWMLRERARTKERTDPRSE
jgi:ABC-type transporter Mla MlaB component